MGETTDRLDEVYRQAFEDELIGLQRRRENDPACTIDDIEGILKNLYIMDGNNWDGRGETTQLALSATIAAYEHFIAEWKKER
jgi:hypothetical protein